MACLHGKWAFISGYYNTSSSFVLDCSIECYADLNPSGENGIDYVEFSTVVNGGAATVTTVSAISIRTPNFSSHASPLPGVATGSMASFYGYGIPLDMDALDAGTIEVSATVFSNLGTTLAMPTVIVYNNKDGSAPPPSELTYYFDAATGAEGNSGTSIGAPKANLRQAIHAAATATGGDIGGVTFVGFPGAQPLVGSASSQPTEYYTSEHHWCNVLLLPGCTMTRQEPYPNFVFFPDPTSGRNFRIKFTGEGFFHDTGFSFNNYTGNESHGWIDGCYSGAANYDPAKPWTVLYGNRGNEIIGHDGNVNSVFKYVTCHTRSGVTLGFSNFKFVRDVRIRDVQGIYLQSFPPNDGDYISQVLCERHRYATNDVLGFIDLDADANQLAVSVPAAGQMRIDAMTPLVDATGGFSVAFDDQCAELVGATTWCLKVESSGNAGNNGNFPVLAVGTSNGLGLSYVVVSNPSAVASIMSAGARVRSATYPGGTIYRTAIHTDILQADNGRTDCMWTSIVARDAKDLRGFVDSGGTLTRCVLVNCSTSHEDENSDWGSNLVDCFFAHNNLYHWNFGGSASGRTNIVDNVCHHQTSMPSGGNLYVRNNHFETGSTVGTNASTGTWHSGDPTTDPWLMTPAGGNLNTASGLLPAPTEWRWSGASADTKGVWRPFGTYDWTLGGGISAVVLPWSNQPTCTPPTAVAATGVDAACLAFPTVTCTPPTAVCTVGTPPVIPPETPASEPSAGGGSAESPRSRQHVKGNPVRAIPLPKRNGFVKLPPAWRSRDAKNQ